MKDLTINQIREKLIIAKRNFLNCGCKIYKEEIEGLNLELRRITNETTAAKGGYLKDYLNG